MDKVYINGRFLTQNVTGVQRYALEICKQFQRKKIDFVLLAPSNIREEYFNSQLPIEIVYGLTGHFWEQLTLPIYLRKNKINKMINFCNTAPIFFSGNYVVIHDLAFFRYPENFSKKFLYLYRFLIPLIFKKSIGVFTVSEFSKKEMQIFFKSRDDIIVAPCSVDTMTPVIKAEPKKEFPYFLAVSSISPHKNFPFLISSFLDVNIDGVKLKIVGDRSKNFISELSLLNSEKIEFLGRVSDEELASLYTNALAFIFPSYYEGFGIPPLEAQFYQCPVIASHSASLPEVLGESVLYIDPYDSKDLSNKMSELFFSKSLRDKVISQGGRNVVRFSWSRSADIFIETLRRKS